MKCDCGELFIRRYSGHSVCKPGCPAREKKLNKIMKRPSRRRKSG